MTTLHKTLTAIFTHHMLVLFGIVYYGFSWQIFAIILLMCIINNIIMNGLFMHLHISHGKYKDNFLNMAGTIIWLLSGQTSSPLGFSYVHRVHHAHYDTEKDPHSPTHIGAFRVWFLLWNVSEDINPRHIKDFAKSKFQLFLHKYWLHLHVLIVTSLLIVNPLIVLFIISPIVVSTFIFSGFGNVRGHAYGEPRDIPEIILWQPVSWRHKHHHSFDKRES